MGAGVDDGDEGVVADVVFGVVDGDAVVVVEGEGRVLVVVGAVVVHCGRVGRVVVVGGVVVLGCLDGVVVGVTVTVTVVVVVTGSGRGWIVIGGMRTSKLPFAPTEILVGGAAVGEVGSGVVVHGSVGVGSMVSTGTNGSFVGRATVGNGSTTSGNGSLISVPVSTGKGSVGKGSLGIGMSLGVSRSVGNSAVKAGQSSVGQE
ncbi:hypothetical protein [Nocardia sp. CC227C]|uniref:hypothetical protein n=1 Tax=Nocardia sp. CC227C TaxID=3044562 RepID=UPI00278C40C1|nr:hypothetical protein [Nocardia sp. CC227C]